MILLTFAHRPEAKAFLNYFNTLKAHPSQKNLYTNEKLKISILITGEGFLSSALTLTRALTLMPDILEVINMGVAGALTSVFEVGDIVQAKTAYLGKNAGTKSMEFKSFPLSCLKSDIACYDIVTTEQRLLSANEKKYYSHFGEIVDREAWGLAQAAQMQHTSFSSIKIISDTLENEEFCQLVKESADKFSSDLLNFFMENINNEIAPIQIKQESDLEKFLYSHPKLFLTVAQKNIITKFSKKIKLSETIIEDLDQIIEQNIKRKPKDISKTVLDYLTQSYSPTIHHLTVQAKKEIFSLNTPHIKFCADPIFESSKIEFSGVIKNENDLIEAIAQLKKLSIHKWKSIINGENIV